MWIKKISVLLFGCLCFFSAKGQEITVRPGIGGGMYAMSDLKDLLRESAGEASFDLKSTDEFPPYLFYQLDVLCRIFRGFSAGLTSSFQSTGGRNHYADYSGSYREDLLLSGINMGGIVSWRHPVGTRFYIMLEVASGIKFSQVDLEHNFVITDEYQEAEAYEMKSSSFWISPQVRLERNIWKMVSVSAFAGYEINPSSKIRMKDNEDLFLFHRDGAYAKTDWSGLRAGLGFSCAFGF